MPTRPYRGLILLNAALLGVLALVAFSPRADAQAPRARAKGQYAMVSGKVQGVTESVIYIADAANEQLAAARYDRSRKSLNVIGVRDLAADAQLRQQKQGGAR
jgi:hypothetical protein